MKKLVVVTVLFFGMLLFVAQGQTQEYDSRLDRINWQEGPSVGKLGSMAEIDIPVGYAFADADDTRLLMEIMQNPTTGGELGFVAPPDGNWYVVFEFDSIGYVRDDEKDSLDVDAILESIKAGTEEGNKERKRRGWPIMTIVGWEQKPFYNEATHNLEWAVRGESQGEPVINYNTRLLGRKGVMIVSLVVEPYDLSPALPKFKTVLSGFDFKPGEKYSEYRQGDKIAKYGLTALIAGGATAVAAKTGVFRWLWKILVVAFIAAAGFLKKLFGKKS